MNQKYKDDLLQDGQNEDATMSVALEQRITTALASDSVASADLAALLEEVDLAIAAMEIEQKKSIDPLASPDAANAWKVVEHAAFVRDRLLRLKPCLEQRLQEVQAEEDLTYWHADHDVIKANRDELAAELRELYPPAAAKIADLFSRLRAFDAELSRLHQARPAGVSEHLLSPELVARGIESFTINSRSLIDEVKLPAFEPGQSQVWPPPRQIRSVGVCTRAAWPPLLGGLGFSGEEKLALCESDTSEKPMRRQLVQAQRGDWWARGRV